MDKKKLGTEEAKATLDIRGDRDYPRRIYLQWEYHTHYIDGITWNDERINDDDVVYFSMEEMIRFLEANLLGQIAVEEFILNGTGEEGGFTGLKNLIKGEHDG